MAIVLPKDKRFLIGFRFPELVPFEMNDFDVSLVLVSLFRRAILEGSDSSRGRSEDFANINASVERFVSRPRLQGFSDASGKRVASRVVQAALTRQIRTVKTKELQIHGIVPLTLASFKVGFPTNEAGFRQVDRFIYSILLSQWNGDEKKARTFMEQVFGEGVKVEGVPKPSAQRLPGDQPALDVLSELSICYVECFDAIVPRQGSRPYVPAKPLPEFQLHFGSDLYRFWRTYADRIPRSLLIDQTIALISLELAILTLKLFHAIPLLVDNPTALPSAMTDSRRPTPPELYLDWVGDPRHASRVLSVGCVRRDIAELDRFAREVFALRYLHAIVQEVRRDKSFRTLISEHLGEDATNDTPGYMRGLLEIVRHPELQPELRWGARAHREAIVAANRSDGDEEESRSTSEAERLVNEMEAEGKSPIEQVQELLYRSQMKSTQSNNQRWLREVGGVGKSYGLISGGSNRRTWSYSPGNELLTVLVQLCAVDYEGWNPAKGAEPREFGLAHFLEWLERRFGIIVDRPPADLGFDGPEYVAAARDNLQAMLRRLRQMGMFEDQSDDFTVQHITPPFTELD